MSSAEPEPVNMDCLNYDGPWECPQPCDADCEVGPSHCVNIHLPNHKRSHNPEFCAAFLAMRARTMEDVKRAFRIDEFSPSGYIGMLPNDVLDTPEVQAKLDSLEDGTLELKNVRIIHDQSS